MAIQSSTGSVSPTSTGTGTNTDNGPKPLNPSSSIPFSFLIAFIALFLFFLGCGLGTRRVAWALRRGFGLDDLVLDDDRRRRRRELRKPEIWDVWPEEMEDNGKWDCVKPLSAKLLTASLKDKTPIPPSNTLSPSSPPILQPLSRDLVSPEPSLGYFPGRIGRMAAPIPPPPHNALSSVQDIRERVRRVRPSGRTPSHANHTRLTGPSRAATVVNANAPPSNAPTLPRQPLLTRLRAYLLSSPYVLALLIEMGVHPRHLGLHRSSADEDEDEVGEVEGMQVGVVIRMPDPNNPSMTGIDDKRTSDISMSSSGEEGKGKQRLFIAKDPIEPNAEGEGMGDYVIGIVEVPWKVPWKESVPDKGQSVTKGS